MATTPDSIDGVPLAEIEAAQQDQASAGQTGICPFPLDEIEVLYCRYPDGVVIAAEPRRDLKWRFMFEGWHPRHGLRFFRARRLGGEMDDPIETVDVTEEYARLARMRLKRGEDKRARRARATVAQSRIKVESPTPERRKRAGEQGLPIARVAAPKQEGKASAQALVYQAPDNIGRLHRNGTITSNMKAAAARFHGDWAMAGLEGLRAAKLERLPRGTGGIDGQTEAALDARNRVHRVYDRLGGYGQPGTQALIAVVGEGATLAAWALKERGGPWRLDPHKAAGVLLSALGVLEGFYRP